MTGVHLGGDTGLFLDGARRLLEGQPLVDREPSYLGYVAVVAASQAVGGGLLGVVLFQIAVATAGAGAVYRLGMELGGARVAAIATGLLTIDFDVNRWHTYVLADSLFLSVFAVSRVARASRGRGTAAAAWRYIVGGAGGPDRDQPDPSGRVVRAAGGRVLLGRAPHRAWSVPSRRVGRSSSARA